RIDERQRAHAVIVDTPTESPSSPTCDRIAADDAAITRQRAPIIVNPPAEPTIRAAGNGVAADDTRGHVQAALIVDPAPTLGCDVTTDKTALEGQPTRLSLYAAPNISAAIVHGQVGDGDEA